MHEIRQDFYMKKHGFQDDGKRQTLAYREDADNTQHKIMLVVAVVCSNNGNQRIIGLHSKSS
jgi:hypothetical protein